MKKKCFAGFICELSLCVMAFVCMVISIVYGDAALISVSALETIALLFTALWVLWKYLEKTESYHAWLWHETCHLLHPYGGEGNEIKKDRLRYTKNKLSSTLAIIGIVFNVLYFVSIYSSDVGDYFYTYVIGMSVIYNLLFLLCTFLSSEGVKSYKLGYAITLVVVGALQIGRIFYIPTNAHSTLISIGKEKVLAMSDGQFVWVIICLILSAVACISAGVIGIYKTKVLEGYSKQLADKEAA